MQVLGVLFCVNYISLSGGARAVESCIRRVTFCVCSCRETYTDYQSECKETYEEETEEEGASSASFLFSVSASPSSSLLPLPRFTSPDPPSLPNFLKPHICSNHLWLFYFHYFDLWSWHLYLKINSFKIFIKIWKEILTWN